MSGASGAGAGVEGAPDGTLPEPAALEVVASEVVARELNRPSDLEWNPYVEDELWVMNRGDSSATIVSNASSEQPRIQRRTDPEGPLHFMPSPNAFAFGRRETSLTDAQGRMVEGTFATCPGSSQEFMGPTLWTSDLRIFAITKRAREAPFNGADTGGEGPGSHLDMLHRTPSCSGIAWGGAGNIYWTFSRSDEMFVKYDFAEDHGIGNADHSDGSVWRYPAADVFGLPDIPSHLVFHPASGLLYLADSGNGRIVTFDPESSTDASPMSPLENLDRLEVAMDVGGGELNELVPASYGLRKPCGIEIHDDRLYVTDNETGTIHKFSLDGTPLGTASLTNVERGALAGLDFGPDGKLYVVDMVGDRVLRLDVSF